MHLPPAFHLSLPPLPCLNPLLLIALSKTSKSVIMSYKALLKLAPACLSGLTLPHSSSLSLSCSSQTGFPQFLDDSSHAFPSTQHTPHHHSPNPSFRLSSVITSSAKSSLSQGLSGSLCSRLSWDAPSTHLIKWFFLMPF